MDTKINQNIDVSIIYVNYYSFELTSNSIDSLHKYCKDLTTEIIIVDNASKDGSAGKLKSKYSHVIIIENKENLGFAAANNIGLRNAIGKYVLFLNNDTILLEDSISKVYSFLEQQEKSSLVGCKLVNEDYSIQCSVGDFLTPFNNITANFFLYLLFPKNKYFNRYHLMNSKFDGINEVESIVGAFIFGLRSDILSIGGFDDRFFFYGEDSDLCKRFKQNDGKVFYYPKTKVIHIKGSSANKNQWFKYKNRSIAIIQWFQKHYSTSNFLLSILVHYLGLVFRIPLFFTIGVLCFRKSMLIRAWYYVKLLFIYPTNVFKT